MTINGSKVNKWEGYKEREREREREREINESEFLKVYLWERGIEIVSKREKDKEG